MNKYKNLTLFVYKGSSDLPSIEPKCAQLLFFLKLHEGHRITIVNTECSSNPNIPCLWYKKELITDQKQIFEILYREVTPSCDMMFNPQQRAVIAEHIAIINIMMESPYILYCWGIKANARYLKNLYIDEKYLCVKKEFGLNLNRHNMLLLTKILDTGTFNTCSEIAMESVEVYLEHLEDFLADKIYMFGDTPSTFDAHVCGYLAPILRLKFPISDFQEKLLKHRKLCRYVQRFLKTYGEKYVDCDSTMPKPNQDNSTLKRLGKGMFWISLIGLFWAVVFYS